MIRRNTRKPSIKKLLKLFLIMSVTPIIFSIGYSFRYEEWSLWGKSHPGLTRNYQEMERIHQYINEEVYLRQLMINQQNNTGDQTILSDLRKFTKRILEEGQHVQEFLRQISIDPHSAKAKEMIAEYLKNVFPLNDLVHNIKTLNKEIALEDEDKLEKLYKIGDLKKHASFVLAEAEEIQEFARQVSVDTNSTKSKILHADNAKTLWSENDLVHNIKILNDAIHEESKEELEKLHGIVQKRIKKLQNPQDCRTAKKLVCREIPYCGLGCNFHHFGICLFIALGTSRTMILDFNEIPYTGAKDVFQPLSENCLEADLSHAVEWKGEYSNETESNNAQVVTVTIQSDYFRDTRFAPFTIPQSLEENLLRLHDDQNNWWIGQIMEYLTRLQPWVLDKIEDVKSSMNLAHPYVGIHVRRTDKKLETDYHHLEEYMVRVDDWYNRYNTKRNTNVIRKVYITSDEMSVYEEDIKRFPDYKFVKNPNAQNIGSMDRMSKDGLVLMVCDLMILSQSDYFVGTFSSNVGRLVMQLMQAKQDATFMTHSLDNRPLYNAGYPQYHEAIKEHIAAEEEISMHIGDVIEYNPYRILALYKGYGKNLRTNETGSYPLYKVKEVIVTAPYPEIDVTKH